jgi:hypothetical protein
VLAGQVMLAAKEGMAVAGGSEVATFTSSNLSDSASAYTATIDWGDGTTSTGVITGSNGSFTVDTGTSHTPSDEGTLTVTVTRPAGGATTTMTAPIGDTDAFTHPLGLFSGTDAAGIAGVWVTDGTAAGTTELPLGGALFPLAPIAPSDTRCCWAAPAARMFSP